MPDFNVLNPDFSGNILAATSITLNTGSTLDGRALALDGAVTLDDNSISQPVCLSSRVPDGGATLGLFSCGLTALLVFRQRCPATA